MPRYRLYTTRPAARICPYAKKSAPECPNGASKTGIFFAPGARLLVYGQFACATGQVPIGRSSECTQSPSHRALRPQKQQICPKNKKQIARRNRTNDHQTTRQPQQITMGSETMDLTIPLQEPPIPPTS